MGIQMLDFYWKKSYKTSLSTGDPQCIVFYVFATLKHSWNSEYNESQQHWNLTM